MYKPKIVTAAFLILLASALSFAQLEKRSLSLSLEDCILTAMKNNIGVAVEVLNPELAGISVSLANEKYWPTLSFSFGKRDTITASYSFLDAADEVSTKSDTYSTQISQIIPTGGTFSIALDGSITDTNRTGTTINPRYGNTLTLSFTQPLLQNFGFKVNRRDIIIARNNLDISESQLRRVLQDTVYNVEEAYWNLVYFTENLEVKRQSLKLAQDLLAKNMRAVEVGTLAPIEVLSAQSAVATREADILQAEAQLKNSEDVLKTIINLSAEEAGEGVEIIPVDKPAFEKKEISLDEALRAAVENRPELEQTRIDLKNKEINVSYAKNQLLPNLSFQASYWSPGVSGTELIFDPFDRFGPPIGSVPHSASEALKDVFNFIYNNWSVGLSLNIPLDNLFSRASYAQAKVNLEQAMLRLKNQEQQIFLEIKNAVRAVQTDYKRIQALKLARELAQKKLEAEEERLKVGLSTSYFVLQYQTDLTTARTSELKAIIDYSLSSARLNRAMGTSLENKNIKLSEIRGE